MKTHNQASGFHALGVAQDMCDALRRHNIVEPTPIQEQSIPVALDGKDLVGLAQTGTGKTLAFALPMLDRLAEGTFGLVLAPTRELAQQIAQTYAMLGARCALVVGGQSMLAQERALRSRPWVVVATPGRLEDHMRQGTVRLDRAAIVVLDEADRMLDMGFAPAIKRILADTPNSRQTLLFSATFPADIADLADGYLRRPVRIEASPAGTSPSQVSQELVYVEHTEKPAMLAELLDEARGTVLVFARTRHGARKLTKSIRNDGHKAAEIHADRTPAQRRDALEGFKDGRYRILVATDIAARGIDVRDIELVVNYDVPQKPEDYVHRIGRTGRAGATGRAVTIAIPEQAGDVRDIEKLLGEPVEVSSRSTVAPQESRPQGRRRRPAPSRPVHAAARPTSGEHKPQVGSHSRPTHGHGRLFGADARPTPSEPRPAATPAANHPQASARPGHRGWSGRPRRRR
jgi:ATP-dependent RNA helicase RhlE